MNKALLLSPMGSVHRRFNQVNIEALLELGYEVHLAANFDVAYGTEKQNQEYVEECRLKGIRTHNISFQRHSLIKNTSEIYTLKMLLRKENFDIVHTHTETGGLLLRLAGRVNRNTKYIYTPHGMSFYKGSSLKSQLFYRPIEYWICSGMDANLAINIDEYETLKAWNQKTAYYMHGIGLDIERIVSVNKDKYEIRLDLGIPTQGIVALSIGELDDNKNHKVVIEALSRLKRNDLYYVICGVGSNKESLINLAKDLGVEKYLRLAGYRQDISDVIAASDIFVFPSFHEGLPVSLMEAMAGGLPIICSDIRGNKDLIVDNQNGLLVPPDSSLVISEKLASLIANKNQRAILGENAFKSVGLFSKEKVFIELRSIYKWIE